MSRRARRSKSSTNKDRTDAPRGRSGWSTWLLRGMLLVIALVAVGSIGGYMWLRKYLAGEDFRNLVVRECSRTLDAEVQLSPLRWDGFRVHADLLEASGEGNIKSLKVEGVRTGIQAGQVANGIWSVVPSRIGNVSLTWDTTVKPVEKEPEEPATPKQPAWYDSFIPREIETEAVVVNDSDLSVILKAGPIRLTDTRWELEPMENRRQAKLQAHGGSLRLPYAWLPELRIDKATTNYQDGQVFLTNANVRMYDRGLLTISGEWDTEDNAFALEGELQDVTCAEVLPADWKQRLTGVVGSGFVVKSSDAGIVVEGKLQIRDGSLTALPVLDKLAAYSQSLRFRTLTLHDATCDFHWQNGIITLRNVKLGSEGLARMEGSITMRPLDGGGMALDGDFQVGLAPGTLATIPGAEEDVFSPGPRGLLWAPMKLTGTMKDPKEDLSERLMKAAGERMFDILPATGAKVLKFTQQVVEDGGKPLIDQATKAGNQLLDKGLEKVEKAGAKAVEGATKGVEKAVDSAIDGVFRSILGGGDKNLIPVEPPKKIPQSR